MTTFENKLEKYAALAVEIGVNVQPGQTLVVSSSLTNAELVRKITKHAYKVGAKDVQVDWIDDEITRIRYEMAPDEAFTEYPEWKAKGRETLCENNAAFISIVSADPDLLKGIDPHRVATAQQTAVKALEKSRGYMMSNKVSWCVIASPSKNWAAKVFPEVEESKRVETLWNAIFDATRCNLEDPVSAWNEHIATLDSKATVLNEKKYHALRYTAPGTNLTVELPEGHIWISAGSPNEKGTMFVANLPTEEVFTTPSRNGTSGTVTSTKPLSYNGNLIENFSLTFENGRIVDYKAEKGYESLKSLIETDDGSHYLGEVALVPHRSPISDTNLIFFNTLFDENASNHLAIGQSYAFCLEGGTEMSKEELEKHGLNRSLTHVDFMIGSADMDIDGVTADGKSEPIFRKGSWAF